MTQLAPPPPRPHIVEDQTPLPLPQPQPQLQPQPQASVPFPAACQLNRSPCEPDPTFVDRLCASTNTDVALAMFAKGTSWTRAYATRELDAWYASGGHTSSVRVAFDEELIVLRHRGHGGKPMVSGADGYDVLRWDGTCVSLQSEELTLKRPPLAKQAQVLWTRLDASTRGALLLDEGVRRSLERRGKVCAQDRAEACARAESALGHSVVESVRTRGALPFPDQIP